MNLQLAETSTYRTACLEAILETAGSRAVVLHGGVKKKERLARVAGLIAASPEEPGLVLATGALVGEAFDLPRLDTLVLAFPISFRGKVTQYAGRILRSHPAKRPKRRIEGVTKKKRRRYYGHAALLVAALADLDPTPAGARWVAGLRSHYSRYPALQGELDGHLGYAERRKEALMAPIARCRGAQTAAWSCPFTILRSTTRYPVR